MTVKLLTKHNLKSAQARLSLFMSKCHIVGNNAFNFIVSSLITMNNVVSTCT